MPRGGAARIVELSAEVGDGVKGYSVLRSAITVGSDLLHEVDNATPKRRLLEDAPSGRPIERFGNIVAYAILGGLHHRYARI
jgi:hypothetical protein